MTIRVQRIGALMALCAAFTASIPGGAGAQQAPAKTAPKFTISRANLAKSATFTVTQTLTPKGGTPIARSFRVEIKGEKARLDYEDQTIGEVRYLANEKGVFFYIPSNKNAMKQTIKGGVEQALKVAFSQASSKMASAKKIGVATISGIPTEVYKDPQTGGMVYIGTKPGFRLPVKTILTNEGGETIMEVKNLKLNVALDDSRFALPPGTQIIKSEGGAMGGPPLGG